jgi:DNA-binding NarL/FixJ family response regulator
VIFEVTRCQVSPQPLVQQLGTETTLSVAKQGRTEETDGLEPQVTRSVTCVVIGFDRLFRDILGSVLYLRAGVRVVAEATNGTAGRKVCLATRPDLVILDGTVPGAAVLAVTEQLMTIHAAARAVVITSATGPTTRRSRLPADRYAVVGREESFDQLLARVESLFADRLAQASGRRGPDGSRPSRPLTDRETEIMKLLGEGLTTREIATILQRSPHTIQTHRKRIAGKVGRLGSRISRRIATDRLTRGDGAPERG